MPEPIGFSFAPGADAAQGMRDQSVSGGGSVGQRASSPQQAVRILSLRVPAALPSNAPVSRSLLTNPGSAAPGGSALTSMVRALMEAFKPQQPMPAPMVPTGASPSAPSMPGAPRPTFPGAGAPQPTAPTPQGISDTPPMQQVAPLFDETEQQNAYAGINPWQALGMDDTEQRQAYLQQVMQAYQQALQQQYRGNGAPSGTRYNVETPPVAGGQRA